MTGKIIDWRGSSLEDLKAFPESARIIRRYTASGRGHITTCVAPESFRCR